MLILLVVSTLSILSAHEPVRFQVAKTLVASSRREEQAIPERAALRDQE